MGEDNQLDQSRITNSGFRPQAESLKRGATVHADKQFTGKHAAWRGQADHFTTASSTEPESSNPR